jgi:hypothetical protein
MYSYCIMARKTRRRTQKRSRRNRRRGKSARKKRRSRRQRGGASCGGATESQPAAVDMAPVVEAEAPEAPAQDGGRRRRKTAKKGKKGKKKRKMNEFFKIMLKSKRAGAASFQYKGKTYKGRKHHRLGMVYKKA